MGCELCDLYERRQIVTKLYHEDNTCIVVNCKTHNVPMCVLKRHAEKPTYGELDHMQQVMRGLFPDIKLRGPQSIKDHYHLHEV